MGIYFKGLKQKYVFKRIAVGTHNRVLGSPYGDPEVITARSYSDALKMLGEPEEPGTRWICVQTYPVDKDLDV